jgi:hypothetical protein
MFQIGRDKWISNEEFKTLPRNEWLQCKVMEWRVINEDLNWIAVMFPWNQCCDMRGCIRRAQELMPNVQAISTINQNGIDTFYYKGSFSDSSPLNPDNWFSSCRGPKPAGFEDAPYSDQPSR